MILKLYKAFRNSMAGFKYAYQTQWTIRMEILILIIAIPLAFYMSPFPVHRILMIQSVLLLLIIELLNTAIETTLNRISLDFHVLSGFAKDMASTAMLFAVINAIITWSIIYCSN